MRSLCSVLFKIMVIAIPLPNLCNAEQYKSLPPQGIDVPAKTLEPLKVETDKLRKDLDAVVQSAADTDEWRADVEVFVRAVELAIDQNLFYKTKDIDAAKRALVIGKQRLDAVKTGKRRLDILTIGSDPKMNGKTVVGGFISSIDGSVQPYGLVLPEGMKENKTSSYRLDVWLHGRGDTNTEVPFLLERLSKVGQYAPPGVLVLHPFGRHCNAYKFAGETDVYESIAEIKRLFSIDDARISIRGFSMGGAGVWHLSSHNPGNWFAANPGAGFVETVKYQGWDKKYPYEPGEYGRKLLAWYDVPPIAENFSNTKLIAYSGEIDKQRESAEMMLEAIAALPEATKSTIEVKHIIGKGMGHKIDPPSEVIVDRQLAKWESEVGKTPNTSIHFKTPTLRYHRVDWFSITGLGEHWQWADVEASISDEPAIHVRTDNVTSFELNFAKDGWPLKSGYLQMEIDGQEIDGPAVTKGMPLVSLWTKRDGIWEEQIENATLSYELQKRPGLQGPIDDALTASFLFVLPSRPCRHGIVQRFVSRELEFARDRWQRIMRGNDRVVLDSELTPEQIENNHLVCFGDFTSNRYLASIASRLPITWTDETLVVSGKTYDPSKHAAVFVYPNPQSPNRYVVVNSGLTFREFSNTSNSRQIAMLPDWAVLDVTEPSDKIFPGKVITADFFNEAWQWKH